jgi:nucleoside-diphosphate-sugar epimerase
MILVTGGTGLIGRELVRRLRQQGIQGRIQSRKQANTPRELWIGNITNPETVEAAVRGVELVYHLAARVDHFASSAELYQTNVLGTAHVVRAALKQCVRRLVHCSTVSAEKGGGTTAYGQSKIQAEGELRSLGDPASLGHHQTRPRV